MDYCNMQRHLPDIMSNEKASNTKKNILWHAPFLVHVYTNLKNKQNLPIGIEVKVVVTLGTGEGLQIEKRPMRTF
jgi:hypothetical protein